MLTQKTATSTELRSFENFALEHNLRIKRDSCGEPLIVPGNPRRSEDISHVYQHNDTDFGLVLLFDTNVLWKNAKKRLLGIGFTLLQDGETEGVLVFSPTDPVQVAAAIKIAGLKKHRRISPEQRSAKRDCMLKVRANRLSPANSEL